MTYPRLTLRWLIQTMIIGFLAGLALHWVFSHGPLNWGNLCLSGLVGVVFSLCVGAGLLLGNRLLAKLPERGRPSWIATRYFLGWLTISGLCTLLAVLLVRRVLGIDLFGVAVFSILLLLSLSIAGVITGFHLMRKQVQLSRELGLAQARAQSLALQAQLSPHTLFNSLNTIAALIPEQPGAAEEAVQRLSRLLRRILSALDQESWTLNDEFSLVEDLLEMERVRFGERMSYHLELTEEEGSRQVPPLILLPLVENSLKHGFRPKVGHCHVEVRANGGCVLIADNGVGRMSDAPDGLGLRNVRQRLEALGGSLLWLQAEEGCAVEVRLCP
jgi:sensor histidine kinase YesM